MKLKSTSILLILTVLFFGCETEILQKKIKNSIENAVIDTDNAPKAIGPYSQAVLAGNTLYSSGQIAIDPISSELNKGSIEQQTNQIMANHQAILKEANMDLSDIVKVTVYLTDLDNYKAFNSAYSQHFLASAPARETVEVSKLPAGAELEISLIAVKQSDFK